MKSHKEPQRLKHRHAVKDPEVAESLGTLKKEWESLGTVQRASALAQLATSGCTLRGLADDLARSEGVLRWYLHIAKLSETDK